MSFFGSIATAIVPESTSKNIAVQELHTTVLYVIY